MTENNNKCNGFVSACLWFGILGYLAITVSYIVTMYGESFPNIILGVGLCSMLALADALGVLLLLRWSKNGFYLLVLSAVLSAVVNLSVLRLDLLPALYFLIASAIWFVILQHRSGGKSVWSQLKNGWDSKHCRHIYQLFAIVEVILFVLTLIAYGNRSVSPELPSIPKDEQIKTETLPTSPIKSTEDVDSTQESSTKTPSDTELTPIESEKESRKEMEKNPHNLAKESNTSKNDKQEHTSYDLTAAARYLDTHDVWKESEMSKYDDLKDLNRQIKMSVLRGRPMISRNLCHKSKRLQRLENLLMEYDHRSRKQKDRSHIKFPSSTSSINYYYLIMSVEDAIKRLRQIERIDKELDEHKEKISDSIKVYTPTFGLG